MCVLNKHIREFTDSRDHKKGVLIDPRHVFTGINSRFKCLPLHLELNCYRRLQSKKHKIVHEALKGHTRITRWNVLSHKIHKTLIDPL